MNSGRELKFMSIVHAAVGFSQDFLGWVGANPKKILKNIVWKNLWFPHVFCYGILLNIGLYFYTVKIQIQY